MSSGCFSWCPLLIPWKFKNRETKSEVSNEYQIRWYKPFNYVQVLPENELRIVLAKTSVEDEVMATNPKAAVRVLTLVLPSL